MAKKESEIDAIALETKEWIEDLPVSQVATWGSDELIAFMKQTLYNKSAKQMRLERRQRRKQEAAATIWRDADNDSELEKLYRSGSGSESNDRPILPKRPRGRPKKMKFVSPNSTQMSTGQYKMNLQNEVSIEETRLGIDSSLETRRFSALVSPSRHGARKHQFARPCWTEMIVVFLFASLLPVSMFAIALTRKKYILNFLW